jgi:hypothetical protein
MLSRPARGSFVLTLLALCAFVAACRSTGAPEPAPDAVETERGATLFDFDSGFWMNMHHFLYASAMAREGNVRGAPRPRLELDEGDIRRMASLSDRAESWNAAVDHYQAYLIERDLLFDESMRELKSALIALQEAGTTPSEAAVESSVLDPALAGVLEKAAPVYRATFWPTHARANRRWIADQSLRLDEHGDAIAGQLAAAYRVDWPTGPLAVDVCFYANWAGAYTTIDPGHITISSRDEGTQRLSGLETLFHEAGHTMVRPIQEALQAESRAQDKPTPRDLWHAIIFYTTGEIVRRTVDPEYVPYAYARGLYERRHWPAYRPLLESAWQSYLDDQTDFDSAIDAIVTGL